MLIIFCGLQERLNRLADEVGKRLDIQTIEHRPSIGKLDAAAAAIEPTARDSLFSTSTTRTTPKIPAQGSPEIPHPLSAAAMRMPAYPSTDNPWAAESSSSTNNITARERDIDVQDLAHRALERQQFVIDDVVAGDDEGDYVGGDTADAELMNQVDNMLSEENTGRQEANEGEPTTAATADSVLELTTRFFPSSLQSC